MATFFHKTLHVNLAITARRKCSAGGRRCLSSTAAHHQQFVIWAPDAPDEGAYERRMKVREQHLSVARPLSETGMISACCHLHLNSEHHLTNFRHARLRIELGGALLNPAYTGTPAEDATKHLIGSMFIIEAENIAAVRKYVEDDIYWTANVVRVPMLSVMSRTHAAVVLQWDHDKLTIMPFRTAVQSK